MSESDLHPSQPIACTLNPIELATHRTELLPGLLSKADTQVTIPEDFRWSFSETDGLLHHLFLSSRLSVAAAASCGSVLPLNPTEGLSGWK